MYDWPRGQKLLASPLPGLPHFFLLALSPNIGFSKCHPNLRNSISLPLRRYCTTAAPRELPQPLAAHADTVQYSIAPPYESTHGILYDPPRHDAPMDDFDAEVIFLDRTKHLFFISLYLRSRARESSRCAAVGISAVRRREACAYFVYILCLLCTRTVQVVSWLQSVRDYQSTSIGRLSPPLLAWQPVVFQGGEYK
jgi:hypothetical protein